MAKSKYLFNPESLSYKKVEKNVFLQILPTLGASLVFGVLIYIVASNFVDSPKVRSLKRENAQMVTQYELLNNKLEQIDLVLKDIQQRDDDIYRAIFEAEPVPSSIRKAGVGGINRYSNFEDFNTTELVVETSVKLDNITKQLVVQSKSFDDVIHLISDKEQMLACIPAIQPIPNKKLNHRPYGYGPRIDPVYKTPAFHQGMDFSAPTGTEIYATGNGIVVDSKYSAGGFGKKIDIDHGYSYLTRYAHLNKIIVQVGDSVKRGQVIGYVGNTGKSTGPHLHYEVHYKGRTVNPINYYYNDLSAEQYNEMIELVASSGQAMD